MVEDVTKYLDPLNEEEEAVVRESRRVVDMYKGYMSSCASILVACGWDEWVAERVVGEWWSRDAVRKCKTPQRAENFLFGPVS